MKKLILIYLLLLLSSKAGAQMFSPIGKGMDGLPVMQGADKHGNMAVVLQKGFSDIFDFYLYNKNLNQWKYLNTYRNGLGPFDPLYYGGGTCILINDTVYITWTRDKGQFVYACDMLLRVTASSVDPIYFKGSVPFFNYCPINIVNLNDKILVAGYFDSIYHNGNMTGVKNQAYLQGNTWKAAPVSDSVGAFEYYQRVHVIRTLNDTIAFIHYINKKTYLKRYTLNGYIDSFMLDSIGIFGYSYTLDVANKSFVVSRVGWWGASALESDTVVIIKGNNLKKINTIFKLRGRINIVGEGEEVFVKPGDGHLYKWNMRTNSTSRIFRLQGWDSVRTVLFAAENHVYLKSAHPILYKDQNYKHLCKINTDSAEAYGLDTVFILPFYDQNKDFSFNGSDQLLNSNIAQIVNTTKWQWIQGQTDTIPDYENCYYFALDEIKWNGLCLFKTFSGQLISNNRKPGVTRDTLWFPYQEMLILNNQYNLQVYFGSGNRHRLWQSHRVDVMVNNLICDGSTGKATLRVELPPKCRLISSGPGISQRIGNMLYFDFIPGSSGWDIFSLDVEYDTDFYKAGDMVSYKAWITPEKQDNPNDNYAELKVLLTYSYDPNRKYSIPGGIVKKPISQIQYHIDFENEGNDYAEQVIIRDTLDPRFPIYEFQMVNASHPYKVALQGNVVIWTFDNINLAPKKQNSYLSKGFVNFIARINGELKVGDSIRNRASIYFDYNEPIITNYAVLHFPYGNKETYVKGKGPEWRIYPNPANNVLAIGQIQGLKTLEIFNMQGQSVWKSEDNTAGSVHIPVSHWSRGVYMLVDSEGHAQKFMLR